MVDNRASFRPKPGEIPTAPGVYRFSDRHGRVLYIGKAKNLRNRLNNYFQPLLSLQPRTQLMVQLAAKVDWTVVPTDTDSLILEHTWINEFNPPFNVQFRDDKSYPLLAVTLGDAAPRVMITRNQEIAGAKYFGPYPKVWAVKETLALLQSAFPMRTCNDADYNRAMRTGRPCLAGQIGRCHGPCSGKVSFAEHKAQAEALVQFMRKLDQKLITRLRQQMLDAAAAENFEEAASLRDRMLALEHVLEKNSVVFHDKTTADFFAIYGDELLAGVHQFIVQDGRIRGERSWLVEVEKDASLPELLSQAIQSAYEHQPAPKQLYVSQLPADSQTLAAALKQKSGSKAQTKISVPERGEKHRLLESALKNAGEHLQRHKLQRTASLTARTDALAQLQTELQLAEPPLRIECIDVSHLQGSNVVASLVVFEDGLPAKGAYRKYKIAETTDDTDSIYQVVSRRAKQLQEQQNQATAELGIYRSRPQLLVVDGGQPQVRAAARALADAGITDIALCGIAKRLEELWIPDDDFPLILPRNSEAMFMLQRLRDEAHRFALSFQRQQRSKAIATVLSEVPGVGQQRVKTLLNAFGSAARVRQASVAEIAAVNGIGHELASAIHQHLHNNGSQPSDIISGDEQDNAASREKS